MDSDGETTIGERSATSGKRAKRPTSSVWDIFVKLPVGDDGRLRARCTRCGQTLMADVGTSSLNRHISEARTKFDKYWENYSLILSLAIVLDPRYKMRYVKFCFEKIYPHTYQEKIKLVRDTLYGLYEAYLHNSSLAPLLTSVEGLVIGMEDEANRDDVDMEFDEREHEANRNKSLLDAYLEEKLLDRKQNAHLDILEYWKTNRLRYPELSLMARDVLSIPITTVASESAFSHGGRIIGKFRNSILPDNVEAIVCTRDWLEAYEDSDDEEQLATDFESLVTSFSASSASSS